MQELSQLCVANPVMKEINAELDIDAFNIKRSRGELTKESVIKKLKTLSLESQLDALAIAHHASILDGVISQNEAKLMNELASELDISIEIIENRLRREVVQKLPKYHRQAKWQAKRELDEREKRLK
jgi:tellurite resistance protein